LKRGHNIKYLPWAFTEHGAIMAAAVLNSPRAVEMSVFVVRAFVRLREFARGHTEIGRRLDALEQKVTGHDDDLREMFDALRALLTPSPGAGREIGFVRKAAAGTHPVRGKGRAHPLIINEGTNLLSA